MINSKHKSGLSNDDVRLLRDVRNWWRQNRHTAQLPNQGPQRWPRSAKPIDWVTIKVKNITNATIKQWSPVRLHSLVDPTDPSSNNADYPVGLLHPDRLFNCVLRTANPTPYSLGHAVVVKDVPANGIETAVVRGVVPGMIQSPASGFMQSSNTYVPTRVVPAQSTAVTGLQRWIGCDGSVDDGIASHVIYSWATTANYTWGMIDVNGLPLEPKYFSDFSGAFGIDHPIYKQELLTLSTTPVSLACFQNDVAPAMFLTNRPGGTIPAGRGLKFHRFVAFNFTWNLQWTPANLSGTANPSIPGTYQYQSQNFYLQWKYTPSGGAAVTTKIADHYRDASVGFSSTPSYTRESLSGQVFVNGERNATLELQAAGTGKLQNINTRLSIFQWSSYPVEHTAGIYNGPGNPSSPIQPL